MIPRETNDDGFILKVIIFIYWREKVGLQCLCTKVTLNIRFLHTTAIKPVCYVSRKSSMLDRNARVIWNTCKILLEKEAFCNDEPRQSRQGGKFCLLECIEIFAKTHWKEKHVCPNL